MAEVDGGIIFEGTKSKLMAGLFGRNPTLLPTKLMKETTLPKSKFPYVERGSDGHQQQWVKACKQVTVPTLRHRLISQVLTETVLMGNLAIRSYNFAVNGKYPGRKKLLWDGENMKITNFDEANQFVKRQYSSWESVIIIS
jgi:hypothetical protein